MFSFLFLSTLVSIVDKLPLSQSYKSHEVAGHEIEIRFYWDDFIGTDDGYFISCGVTTCGMSECRLKTEKGHIFYCKLWKFKSCARFLFPASASGYFVQRFPQCVSACVFASAV